MAKKKAKKVHAAPLLDLDQKERDLFLKAFYTGEIAPEENTHEDDKKLLLRAFEELNYRPRVEQVHTIQKFSKKRTKYIDATLDLHGMIVEDALKALRNFLKEEQVRGSKTLLVVHGKGTGTLRNAVWEVLERDYLVYDFQAAPSRLGGSGALIVRINRSWRR
jgi:DNA-nicking Smr family endonuclease